jgi:putative tricarboxylic transport membrane protein
MRAPAGQVAVSAGVTALGVVILWGSFYLPTGGGYAQVGPGVVPRFVGIILILLGAALLREAYTGGYRGVDEEAEVHLPMDWAAFAWITGGIIAYGLLVERLGFILASIVLYVMVARSFKSHRWGLNIAVGAALAIFIFVTFNYGLGLNLPLGVFQTLLT